MLKLALILFSLVVWVSIFAYFWWPDIIRWLDNRFGKDSSPPDPDAGEEDASIPPPPLFTEAEPKKEAPAKSESSSS